MKKIALLALLTLCVLFPVGVEGDTLPPTYTAGPLPMRPQQDGPTCVVESIAVMMASQDYRENGGRFPKYDVPGFWAALKARGEASDLWGSDVRSALTYVRDVGLKPVLQPRQRIYRSWRDGKGGFVRQWTTLPRRAPAFGGARSRIDSFVILPPDNPDAIKAAIIANGPVVLALAWDINWSYTLVDGTFKDPVGRSIGGHAVTLFGWTTSTSGETLWYVANQYGEMWGVKGVGKMPDRLRQFWWYVAAVSDINT